MAVSRLTLAEVVVQLGVLHLLTVQVHLADVVEADGLTDLSSLLKEDLLYPDAVFRHKALAVGLSPGWNKLACSIGVVYYLGCCSKTVSIILVPHSLRAVSGSVVNISGVAGDVLQTPL